MKRGVFTTATALVCAVSAIGCAKTTVMGYQYQYEQTSSGEDAEPAPVEARQLLATAKTVAFYPPDRCINTTDKAETEKEFRANCGVLLSLLERAAERAGYEVVSWVNLRGSSRPIDYARDAKVDVLFEINEVASEAIGATDAKRTLTFFNRTGTGDVPLNVSGGVAQRCYGWSQSHDSAPDLGETATIDIKTVSVSDGRARWHYRKTDTRRNDVAPPKARFVGMTKPSKIGQSLVGAGGATLIVGATFWLVDEATSNMADPVTGQPKDKLFGDIPFYLMGLGAIVLAGGIAISVVQKQSAPSADDVLCLDTTVPSDGLYDYSAPTAAPQMQSGSQHTFNEHSGGDVKVAAEKRRQKAIADIVQDFVDLLISVKASQRAPATTPPPDGAPAPAPPAP